tara:strand:- start:1019 stop:1453 length:435 start_codon:yes stop_codon:yes gene_type:complete
MEAGNMASYIDSNLIGDEVVQYRGRVSLWSLAPKILLGLFFLPASGLGLLFLASAAITYYSTELAVTNKRVVAKVGFIWRKTVEMNIPKIESLQVKQGILGRLFNYGSVIVSGAGNPQAPIPGISNPVLFKNRYFEVQESLSCS